MEVKMTTIPIAPQMPNGLSNVPSIGVNGTTNHIDNDKGTVLLNTFTIRKKSYRVFFNAGILLWELNQTGKGKRNSIGLNYLSNQIFMWWSKPQEVDKGVQ